MGISNYSYGIPSKALQPFAGHGSIFGCSLPRLAPPPQDWILIQYKPPLIESWQRNTFEATLVKEGEGGTIKSIASKINNFI